jgi:hypothetical protein
MAEDADDGEGVGEEGEDAPPCAAIGAAEREVLVDPGDQPRPAGAGRGLLGCRGSVVPGAASRRRVRLGARGEDRDALPQAGPDGTGAGARVAGGSGGRGR